MVKQRMGIIDVAAEVASLRAKNIQGCRLVNIYDINSKTYLLKLARSGEDGEKILLLIESGARFHTINTVPDKAPVPSNFTMKLRKHIRTRRLEDIQQLGVDRIVRFTFGTGDKTHHLILELYDKGNLILVDEKYMVLSLLRSHLDSAKGVAIMPGHTYAIQTVRLRQRITLEALETGLNGKNSNNNNEGGGGGVHHASSSSSSSRVTLKQALTGELTELPYGTVAITHCCLSAGLNPDRPIIGPDSTPLSAEEKNDLLKQLKLWDKWLDALGGNSNSNSNGGGGGGGVGGVILTKATPPPKDKSGSITTTSSSSSCGNSDASIQQQQYDEYYPLLEDGSLLEQYKSYQTDNSNNNSSAIIFPNSFDDALKQFYTAAAEHRAVAARFQREHAATKKLDAIREDHKRRLEALEQEAKESETKAVIIECNLDMVDAAMNAVRDAVSAGMDWAELDAMIKEEKKGGNPVAALVDSLQLGNNKVTVLLPDLVEEEGGSDYGSDNDEDGERGTTRKKQQQQQQQQQQRVKKVKVQLDLSLSAYANARTYYEIRRKQLDKQQRTIAASKDALKAAEQRAAIAVAKEKARSSAQAAMSLTPARKPYWFEKFHWFISSENYLVLSGRDAQQNELLVKKYLKRGDVYVHADLHGASSTIIINHQTNTSSPDDITSSTSTSQPPPPPPLIPPLTLSQAGQACICRSAAWDAKVVTSAWWVHHDQVSKTAPSGEYLVTGSFMIRGKKNFLPPQPLVMGFGFMFKLDEESIAAHLGERAPREAGEEEEGEGGRGRGEEAEGEEEGEEEEEEEESAPTTTTNASTAYEAFMDASADTLGLKSNNNNRGRRSGSGTTTSGVEDITASFSKYGLSASAEKEEEEEEEDWSKGGGGQNSKRHLSAKERQLMKKKGSGGGGGGDDRSEQLSGKGKKKQQQNSQQQQQEEEEEEEELHPVGGGIGKGKLNLSSKKAQKKKKYRHQDEEERELAMMMLQSAGQKKDKRTKKEDRKRRMAAKKAGRKSGYLPQQDFSKDDIARLTAQLQEGDKEEEDEEDSEGEDSDSSSSSSEGEEDRRKKEVEQQQQQQPANDDEKVEVAALLAEENLDLIDEEDLAKLSMLDTLTGNPRSEDTLLYAIPVCAPYSVLSAYKHRVKLVPGNLKKGKAVRQATEMLIRNVGEGLERERDLMRGCPEQDGINLMVGGCRLQMPGLQKMQQAKRQQGKQQKKKKNGK